MCNYMLLYNQHKGPKGGCRVRQRVAVEGAKGGCRVRQRVAVERGQRVGPCRSRTSKQGDTLALPGTVS